MSCLLSQGSSPPLISSHFPPYPLSLQVSPGHWEASLSDTKSHVFVLHYVPLKVASTKGVLELRHVNGLKRGQDSPGPLSPPAPASTLTHRTCPHHMATILSPLVPGPPKPPTSLFKRARK